MLANDTHACTYNFSNDEICFKNIKTVLTALLSFFALTNFLKKLNLSKWMNKFYLRYYISKTISKAIGSFSSIDKEIKHCIIIIIIIIIIINTESWRWYLNNRDGDDNNINKNTNNNNNNNTT